MRKKVVTGTNAHNDCSVKQLLGGSAEDHINTPSASERNKEDFLLQQKRYAEALQAQIRHKEELKRQEQQLRTLPQVQQLPYNIGSDAQEGDAALSSNAAANFQPLPTTNYPNNTLPPQAPMYQNQPVDKFTPIINEAEVRKRRLADAMAAAGSGLAFGVRQIGRYGGGSGPLRDPEGNIITDLNAVKQYQSSCAGGNVKRSSVSVGGGAMPVQSQELQQQPEGYANNASMLLLNDPMFDPQAAERQKQQIALRSALDQQIAEKKRLKQEELLRQRQEAAEEEARLEIERQKLREQFEAEIAARAKKTAEVDASNLQAMEDNGVLIKFKPKPQRKATTKKGDDDCDGEENGSDRKPRRPSRTSQDPAPNQSDILNKSGNKTEDQSSAQQQRTTSLPPAEANTTNPATSTVPASATNNNELTAVKGALQEQLEEIRRLKDHAIESERRSIQVLRDVMELTRGRWGVNVAATAGGGGLPTTPTTTTLEGMLVPQQPLLPQTMYVVPTASAMTMPQSALRLPLAQQPLIAVGADALPAARLPILMTTSTLRLEDSRPSTSRGTAPVRNTHVAHSGPVSYPPVIHTATSRLRNTSLTIEEEEALRNECIKAVRPPPQNKSKSMYPTIDPPSSSTSKPTREYKSAKDTSTSDVYSKSSRDRAIDSKHTKNSTSSGRNQLAKKSRWRGSSKLWPFGPVKRGADGLWAWEEHEHHTHSQ